MNKILLIALAAGDRVLDLGAVPRARRHAARHRRAPVPGTAKAINESDLKERFGQIGIEPVGNTPGQAAKFLDAEVAKWAKVITAAGVKAEQ